MQDAAYDSLLKARRVQLHRAIGETLERDPETLDAHPALLGHHFAHSGNVAKAARYFLRAGEQSAANSAMVEARIHLTRGLELAERIPDAAQAKLCRAELSLALANVQMALHGFGSPEQGAAVAEAVILCRQAEPSEYQLKQLGRALYIQCSYSLHIGEVTAAHESASELLSLGERSADAELHAIAVSAYAITCGCLGRFEDALQKLASLRDAWGPKMMTAPSMLGFGADAVVLSVFSSHRLLACRGFPDQAIHTCLAAIERAKALQHLPTIAICLVTGCDTAWILRDLARLGRWSSELLQIAQEQGFAYWIARAKMYAGWLAGIDHKLGEGCGLIAEGEAYLGRAGIALYAPLIRAMHSELRARAGQPERSLMLLEEALEIASRTGAAWLNAELHRRKGELLRADPPAAQSCFLQALEIARAQSARLFELRASVSLARLWRDQNRPGDARALLAPIYDWFTEGFDTPDLTEARALLEQLATAPG